jgi:hypothetical protein
VQWLSNKLALIVPLRLEPFEQHEEASLVESDGKMSVAYFA